MAHHWSDNVLTTAFTPRDYQVELLAAAREKNTIICLGHNSSKEFIALKLIHELGIELRREIGNNRKITLYLSSDPNQAETTFNLVHYLTDLKVINLIVTKNVEWESLTDDYQVIILDVETCLNALVCAYIDLNDVNLMVVEDCHKNYGKSEFDEIFGVHYAESSTKPKILGLAGPLHSAGCPPGRLGAELEYLEKSLYSRAETASDIVTVLRYCSKPVEVILQCAPPAPNMVTEFLRNLVLTKKLFIKEHRFDPSEIYEGFQDEINVIPDPKAEPIAFLDEFLEVLGELGPWCADRAALSLLVQIEKCKVKTPYERHFLLLCLISTTLVQIRAHCEYIFQKLPSEKERIEAYSTPKVIRLLEVFRQFKPENRSTSTGTIPAPVSISPNNPLQSDMEISQRNQINLKKLDTVNFEGLQKSLEQTTNVIESLPEENKDVTELSNCLKELTIRSSSTRGGFGGVGSGGGGHRKKYRSRGGGAAGSHPYSHHRKYFSSYYQNETDALCGLIFCRSNFFAKILFALFCEMTRNDPDFKYLNVQYTVDKEADPAIDTKEAEVEHRKQEEVLKKFRMHECNLLIGTAVLEEGIDLPKCNLVVRWNTPTTYRSYVQCKGRARAQHAYHIIMVAPKLSTDAVTIENIETITNRVHAFACFPGHQKIDVSEKEYDEDVDQPTESNSSITSTSTGSSSESQIVSGIVDFKCHMGTEIITDSVDNYETERHMIAMSNTTNEMIERLAEYMEIEKMLIRKCENNEPPDIELVHAERFTQCIMEYKPRADLLTGACVNLSTAVSLVNKYCAKLPSDTFTKLTPLWRLAKTKRRNIELFQCTLRLPINSPLKQDIIGLPMGTRILARRMTALIACQILHKTGELDDNLLPIGKENFRAAEPDWENFELEEEDDLIVTENSEPRPGTTKRRQYYYKRIASTFSNCRPQIGEKAYLYHISMILTCPIPEEQNTRGRKIYPPEDSPQGFGILTTKQIPKVSAFPIFTRSGEVKVSLELAKEDVILGESQLHKIYTFINYTFTNVLRLQKYLMLFDSEATENSFFIVPTLSTMTPTNKIDVDWSFLDLISENVDKMPRAVSDEDRKNKEFDANKFRDAVVMPWYRNQDQPQYFYVAEICYHLSPNSSFPGENYSTFQEYYYRKYSIEIQNERQPLLDVDHTSARLNFLTPRYVNRKGVALPTSSEETKRAKRENLEQKQILVPELCTIHPFPASLWRAAVCLPCILYRINALLLADEIRKQVTRDLGLGRVDMSADDNFEWPTLDFGWSLADVLKKSREARSTVVDSTSPENVVQSTVDEDKKSVVEKERVEAKETEQMNEGIEKGADCENGNEKCDGEKTANDILDEADRKLKNACMMDIGVWSNEMAENIPDDEESEDGDWSLPPNINMCSRNNTQIRYGSPTSWDVTTKANVVEKYFSDSDVSYQSDDDIDNLSNYSNDPYNLTQRNPGGLRIEFKSDNVAEAIESEEEILKREKQLAILNDRHKNEKNYQNTKNICIGYDTAAITDDNTNLQESIAHHEQIFEVSTKRLQDDIKTSGMLIEYNQMFELKNYKVKEKTEPPVLNLELINELLPYIEYEKLEQFLIERLDLRLTLDDIYYLNEMYLGERTTETFQVEGTGDMFDNFNDNCMLSVKSNTMTCEKVIPIDFVRREIKVHKSQMPSPNLEAILECNRIEISPEENRHKFSFDYQPSLNGHPGPSPSIILQALTMSNANDGINLERLETIGDSFLKYAITTYLYCSYENVHEGKLSHLRSKQVSNLNLYRLGRRKILGESMIATKFEPHDNWLPPCYYVPRELEKALIEAKIPACHWNLAELPNLKQLSSEEICALVKKRAEAMGLFDDEDYVNDTTNSNPNGLINLDNFPCFIPYNLVTQHSIPDKSIADCVEALIGAYLIECGPRGALLFMAWLGIRVLPIIEIEWDPGRDRIPGSTLPYEKNGHEVQTVYGHWTAPKSPLLQYAPNSSEFLAKLLNGYSAFEEAIGYRFKDQSYLLQAMTHASYSPNRLTDCYQRLEFLGDAVLDYLITRHLYEDPRQHSPGALTDLRSALVNNTIFASLAVRHGFHKYFRHLSPGLNEVIDRFVRIQHENGHSISEEYYLLSEEECDEAEDVEVPKALGDVFESVAGAIFLDSNMSLDTVWQVYSNMMRPEIEQFSNSVPKSPIRELLELEPETAKFGKPEKLADGRRVRVTVEVFGKGTFRGIGRNYRIAKCTAAKCALRQLKKQGLISKKH